MRASTSSPSLTLEPLSILLAICRFDPGASLPAWALAQAWFSVTRTQDELSVVCPEAAVPAHVHCESGWRALKVLGPLPFSLTGVLAALTLPLAQAGISLFAVSTFDTDYVLIKSENFSRAVHVLQAAGHAVKEL